MRGDRQVDYGTVMKVMGRLSAAGFRRVALVTEVEQRLGAVTRARREMRTAYTISAVGHAAVLLWSVWSLAAKPLAAPPSEALPVDHRHARPSSRKITAGSKDAPKAETPKPLVEKVAEAKPVEDPTAKVVEKKEIKAAREPPPPPEPSPSSASRARRSKQAGKKKAESAKPDPIAEAMEKDESEKARAEEGRGQAADAAARSPRRRRRNSIPSRSRRCSTSATPTRLAAAGETPQQHALARHCRAAPPAQLSHERARCVARAARAIVEPAGRRRQNPHELVRHRSASAQAGRHAGRPADGADQRQQLRCSWPRATAPCARVLRGQPFDMLKPEHYEQWKDIEITFDPRDMMRG